jgi:hypothetical protein
LNIVINNDIIAYNVNREVITMGYSSKPPSPLLLGLALAHPVLTIVACGVVVAKNFEEVKDFADELADDIFGETYQSTKKEISWQMHKLKNK